MNCLGPEYRVDQKFRETRIILLLLSVLWDTNGGYSEEPSGYISTEFLDLMSDHYLLKTDSEPSNVLWGSIKNSYGSVLFTLSLRCYSIPTTVSHDLTCPCLSNCSVYVNDLTINGGHRKKPYEWYMRWNYRLALLCVLLHFTSALLLMQPT